MKMLKITSTFCCSNCPGFVIFHDMKRLIRFLFVTKWWCDDVQSIVLQFIEFISERFGSGDDDDDDVSGDWNCFDKYHLDLPIIKRTQWKQEEVIIPDVLCNPFDVEVLAVAADQGVSLSLSKALKPLRIPKQEITKQEVFAREITWQKYEFTKVLFI